MQLRTPLSWFGALSLVTATIAQAPETAARPPAEAPNGELNYTIGTTTIRRWIAAGVASAAMSRDGGATWQSLLAPDDRLLFALAEFDPLAGGPLYPGALAAPADTHLLLVQFHTQVLPDYRTAVSHTGCEILHFLPANALFVRGDAAGVARLRALPCVRWVGPLQNAFKLDDELRAFATAGDGARELNLMLAAKGDRARAAADVQQVGGALTDPCDGSMIIRASLTQAQLVQLLARDTVIYADAVTAIGFDVDNARIQGGANYVETLGGYGGNGVRAEIAEWIEETHPDFVGRYIVRGTNDRSAHGHCTAGIVGGAGAGDPTARGMMPLCTVIEGGYGSASAHYAQITGSPQAPWFSMQVTSSWGSQWTTNYTTTSAVVDDALFDSDVVRTQSMSNRGATSNPRQCRPEAWAKNTISVGGVKHGNNSNPADDNWNSPNTGSAGSIGPANDGRMKPEVAAYYDSVLTSDITGVYDSQNVEQGGYSPTNYYTAFSGTSSATPIVNGHVGIVQEMFTDGLFGNELPLPATPANRFANRPHMSTVKALLCNTAAQYTFSGTTHDLTRSHVGWGFPSLSRLYDHRNNVVVLDEYDTLQVGQTRAYFAYVAPGTSEFRVTVVYTDPAGPPSPAIQLINNANLKVTRLSDGTFWWGNNGLAANMFSTSGGTANDRDNHECVCLQNPQAGVYTVAVSAASVVQDAKVETPQIDLDFALVMHPVGGGFRTSGGLTLDLSSTGPGNLTFAVSNVPPAGWTDGYTALSFSTARALGFGNFFGLELDSLTVALWGGPAVAGSVAHFTNTAGVYPFASFVFPNPGLISFLAGLELDGVVLLWNGGNVAAVSNVDRIVLQ